MSARRLKIIALVSVLVSGVIFFYMGLLSSARYNAKMILGVSFDADYTEYLGLDPKKVFAALVGDWQFKHVRLAATWEDIEPESGQFNFSGVDYYLDAANKHGAKVVLAIGQKTPRWPECHLPAWAKELPAEEFGARRLQYIERVVTRYRAHEAVEIWQVENEPFLGFGVCPPFSRAELAAEVAAVRALDPNHQILVTDSGELSSWRKTGQAGDLFGTTLYRVVWNKYLGYFSYDWLPAAFYRLKLRLVGRSVDTAMVSELQAEPWIPGKHPNDVPLEEQFKSLSLNRLKKNIFFAGQLGVPISYLWGAEWWVWAEERGHGEFIEYIKMLKKE